MWLEKAIQKLCTYIPIVSDGILHKGFHNNLLKIVDLPAPVSPTKATCWPGSTINETLSRAFRGSLLDFLPLLSSYTRLTERSPHRCQLHLANAPRHSSPFLNSICPLHWSSSSASGLSRMSLVSWRISINLSVSVKTRLVHCEPQSAVQVSRSCHHYSAVILTQFLH